jgi:hypothetical protein
MSAIFLRIILYAAIAGAIYYGVRKIVLDWRGRFREIDKKTRERDLSERKRPDVVDLKRGDDGVFRRQDKTNSDRET